MTKRGFIDSWYCRSFKLHKLLHVELETNKQVFYKIYKSAEEIDERAIVKLIKEAVRVDLLPSPVVNA